MFRRDAVRILCDMIKATTRARIIELLKQASEKAAELRDGMSALEIADIERAHGLIFDEIDVLRRQLNPVEGYPMPDGINQPNDNPGTSAAAVRGERERVREINTIARAGDLGGTLVEDAIENGTSVETFRKIALDTLAERSRAEVGTGLGVRGDDGSRVIVLRDGGDSRRRGMTDALTARLAMAGGDRNVEVPAHARAYAGMGLAEMAAECIGHRGSLRTAQQVQSVFDRAFLTTSDFPAIFADSMSRRLLARYQAAPASYRRFAVRYQARDFRPTNVIRPGDFPALRKLNETGEIESGSFSESAEKLQVDPYGVMLNFTRQMLVNDQLGAIDQVLSSTGDRVADWENAKAFEALLSASGAGPTLLSDAVPLFHSSHGNLAGSGGAISIATVGAGRAAMMKQTTLDGIKANFTPSVLLTGPDTLTAAEQLITQITPATNASAVPELLKRLTPIGDANITGNAWYLFADPAVAATFAYGYLEGFEGPRLSTEEQFGVQGVRVKLEHDFGVAAIDFRGGYRNAGP